jgi:hypothetical protein
MYFKVQFEPRFLSYYLPPTIFLKRVGHISLVRKVKLTGVCDFSSVLCFIRICDQWRDNRVRSFKPVAKEETMRINNEYW